MLSMSGVTMMATAHPPSTKAKFTGGVTLTMACGACAGVSNDGKERGTTPAVAVAMVAGRGGAEALPGGNNV